jgi:alpha-glucosidase
MTLQSTTTESSWWRGAVIYQIYPRSFADSNHDGIGDINGIIDKLDYISELGVDGIWLSPFFTSPMKDFGYDISNYRDVDPMFGSLSDFDKLIKKAHSLNLKVMIDQVISHTSDQHPWFGESRKDSSNDKADWYVWAEPQADGTPPNNWLSVFGGSAWSWEPARKQFYLHNFLDSQPDLNFHNPAVVNQVLDDMRFWLERGVDGFRLDTANFYFHDDELRNNPPRPKDVAAGGDMSNDVNLYSMQSHVYDKSRPENIEFLKKLRSLMNEYPNRTTVGEIGDDNSLKLMAEYTSGGDKLHMAYTFDLLAHDSGAEYIESVIDSVESMIGDGWPCWAMSNHDVMRVATRWAEGDHQQDLIRLLHAILFSLRGSVCLYQGEELGLPEADVPFEKLQDPYGITFWPEFKGRDGCRTPMPWNSTDNHAGFSQETPWLPVPSEHMDLTVAHQQQDLGSTLNHCKALLAWRQQNQTLVQGDIKRLEAPEGVLAFHRFMDEHRVTLVFNLSNQTKLIGEELLQQWGVKDHSSSLAVLAFDGAWLENDGNNNWANFSQLT